MTSDELFGGPRANLGNDPQALKRALHRHIIDAIEDSGRNLLEGSRPALAQFVTEQVGDYIARLHLALSRYEMERLAEELVDELTGFGPLEVLLRDTSVTEILVNGPYRVFVERAGVLHQTDLRFIDSHHVERVMQRILAPLGRRLDESSPMVDARMPDGSRVNAIIPPVALDGPCLSIRKFRKDMLKSADLLATRAIDPGIMTFFELAVSKRCNVLVSGGTGTGKTTLLNILSQLISPHERLVTIEDVAELQLDHPHVVRLETRPPNAEGHGEIKASELIRNALRMRPDRIILGEVRGGESFDMLQAMNTGHDGSLCTVHANTPRDAIMRLENMVMMAGMQLPLEAIRRQIASAVNLIVQVERMRDGGRRIVSITEVCGMENDVIQTQELYGFTTSSVDADGRLVGQFNASGQRPQFYTRHAHLFTGGQ